MLLVAEPRLFRSPLRMHDVYHALYQIYDVHERMLSPSEEMVKAIGYGYNLWLSIASDMHERIIFSTTVQHIINKQQHSDTVHTGQSIKPNSVSNEQELGEELGRGL